MPLREHINDDGFIYLVRPFYDRGNVLEFLKNPQSPTRQLTEQEMRHGARTLCRALNTIHEFGFVHGDVRPQSIFLQAATPGKRDSALKIALG